MVSQLSYIIIIIIGGFFVSDFQVFAFFHVFVKCNPYILESHGVGYLVLLLNLAVLTAPS